MILPPISRGQVQSLGRANTGAVGAVASAVSAKSSAENKVINQLARLGGEFIRQEEKARFDEVVVKTHLSETQYTQTDGVKKFFTAKELEGRVPEKLLYDTQPGKDGKQVKVPKKSIPSYLVYPQLLATKLESDMKTMAEDIPNPLDKNAYIEKRSVAIADTVRRATFNATREQYSYLRNESDTQRKNALVKGDIEAADYLANNFNGSEFEVSDRLRQNNEAYEIWNADKLIQMEDIDGIKSMLDYLKEPDYKGPLPEKKNIDVQNKLKSKLNSLDTRNVSGLAVYKSEIKQQGQDVKILLEDGRLQPIEKVTELMNRLEDVKLNDLKIDIRRANKKAPFVDQMSKRPVVEHEAMINEYFSNKGTDVSEVLRGELLQKSREFSQRIDRDATGFFIERNFSKVLGLNEPGFFKQTLLISKQASLTFSVKAKPLSDVTAKQFSTRFRNATITEKTQFIGSLLSEVPNKGDRDSIFKQIDHKNAGNLNVYADILERGEETAIKMIEQGKNYRQDKTLNLIPKDVANKINVALNRAIPIDSERAAYTEAVMDLYASMAYNAGDIGKDFADPDKLEDAISLVVGNVVDYNGKKLILPNNKITSDGMNNWIDTMGEDFITSLGGVKNMSPTVLITGLQDGDITFEPTDVRGEYNLLDVNKNYLMGADDLPFILPYVEGVSKPRTVDKFARGQR